MMKEKASMRMSEGSADHNDRTKSTSKENVIDETRTYENLVYVSNQAGRPHRIRCGEGKLRAEELKLYEECYGASLERKNEHYRKKGNKKAIKTIEEAYASKPPKEMILQIGKGHAHDKRELFEAANDLFGELMSKYENIRIFSIAIHCDEAALHAHVRFTIENQTKFGDIEVNQRAGLEEMGFTEKEPFDRKKFIESHPDVDFKSTEGKRILKDAKEYHDRYDNPTIAFTDEVRETWYKVLEDRGYDINREVNPKNRSKRNKSNQQHKHEQLLQENSKLVRDNIQYKFENEAYRKDTKKIKDMEDFIKESGLEKQFEMFKDFKSRSSYDDYSYDAYERE